MKVNFTLINGHLYHHKACFVDYCSVIKIDVCYNYSYIFNITCCLIFKILNTC